MQAVTKCETRLIFSHEQGIPSIPIYARQAVSVQVQGAAAAGVFHSGKTPGCGTGVSQIGNPLAQWGRERNAKSANWANEAKNAGLLLAHWEDQERLAQFANFRGIRVES
jgi:hypothetical protein